MKELLLHIRNFTVDSVAGIHGDLVHGHITDQTLLISESDIRRRRPLPLVVGYDLHTVFFPHSHARVGRAKIDSNSRANFFTAHCCEQKNIKFFENRERSFSLKERDARIVMSKKYQNL